jgi:hypothetical protein
MKEGYIPSPHITNLREQATLSEKPRSVQPIGREVKKSSNQGEQPPSSMHVDSGSFWDATLECLVEFHDKGHKEAFKMLTDYKARVRQISPPELSKGIMAVTYHEEPFYLANKLAHNDLDSREHIDKYNEIRKLHGLLHPEKG